MDIQLVVVRGRSASQVLKLGEGVTLVGRQEGCQLRINSSQVSRRHCQFSEQNGRLVVKDLGSSNGTFVNGKKVQERALKPGDELTIGSVKLRVEQVGGSGARKTTRPGDTAVGAGVAAVPINPEDVLFEEDEEEAGTETISLPAASPSQTPKAPAAKTPPTSRTEEPVEDIGEDAVADFLMDIKLDED